jgi:hypothetical protein
MAKTAADIPVETMLDWGIDTIFGIPGDGINGITGSKLAFCTGRNQNEIWWRRVGQ